MRKPAQPRPKRVSFAVDREEIDISADWVPAVLRPLREGDDESTVDKNATVAEVATVAGVATVARFGETHLELAREAWNGNNTATVVESATVVPVEALLYPFSPSTEVVTECEESGKGNNPQATANTICGVEDTATDALKATVEKSATVEKIATVETTVAIASDSRDGLLSETEDPCPSQAIGEGSGPSRAAENTATVANETTVVFLATVQTVASLPVNAKPIHTAMSALTPGQWLVYRALLEAGQQDRNGRTLFEGGYHDLCRRTGMSKRGVQNVIAELQAKGAVERYRLPGHHRSQPTVYQIWPEPVLLRRWSEAGYSHVLGKSRILLRCMPPG
jgi:hypothetical protein